MKETIKIPEGVEVEISDENIKIKGKLGEVEKKFYHPKLVIKKENEEIILESKEDTKKVLAILGTWKAHLKNMFKGVTEGFEYRMKITYVHFPMDVKVEGNRVVIRNFLGQKSPRYAKILDGVEVKISGSDVILKGIDRERVGQTAGNIERATRLLKRRDRRKFSDGIYIVSKGEKNE